MLKGKMEVSSSGAETIVGTSVKLKGNLKSDNDIIIDGAVNGEIKTKGSVVVGPNANIVASIIKAKNVIISGSVQGNVEADDRLELHETARVVGDISATVLSISAGAVFTGKSQMADTHKLTEPELVIEEEPKEKEKAEEPAAK